MKYEIKDVYTCFDLLVADILKTIEVDIRKCDTCEEWGYEITYEGFPFGTKKIILWDLYEEDKDIVDEWRMRGISFKKLKEEIKRILKTEERVEVTFKEGKNGKIQWMEIWLKRKPWI